MAFEKDPVRTAARRIELLLRCLIKIDGMNPNILATYAIFHCMMRNYTSARNYYMRAIKLDPYNDLIVASFSELEEMEVRKRATIRGETPKAWFELGPGESPDYGPGPEGETPAEFSRRTGIYPGSGSQSPLEKYLPQKVGGSPTPPKEINILTNLTELKPKLDQVSDPKDKDNDNKDKKKIVIKL